MARSRNVKPGFFTNELLVELPFEYRLLFIGIWTIADREGRLEDRPKKIKMSLFAADNTDIEAGLAALAERGFLLRYAVGGQQYIQVVAWHKHQQPHFKEKASTIPAPDKPEASRSTASNQSPVQAPCKPASSPERAALIPDSLNPIKDSAASRLAACFADFWKLWPKHVAKAAAWKAWRKLEPDAATVAVILAAVRSQSQSAAWLKDGGTFIPHPATWLNGRRWEDEGPRAPDGPRTMSAAELAP